MRNILLPLISWLSLLALALLGYIGVAVGSAKAGESGFYGFLTVALFVLLCALVLVGLQVAKSRPLSFLARVLAVGVGSILAFCTMYVVFNGGAPLVYIPTLALSVGMFALIDRSVEREQGRGVS